VAVDRGRGRGPWPWPWTVAVAVAVAVTVAVAVAVAVTVAVAVAVDRVHMRICGQEIDFRVYVQVRQRACVTSTIPQRVSVERVGR